MTFQLSAWRSLGKRLTETAAHIFRIPWLAILILLLIISGVGILIFGSRSVQLPTNFSYVAEMNSFDNFFSEKDGQFGGEVLTKGRITFKIASSSGEHAQVISTSEVKSLEGERLFFVEREYAIDRSTQAHLPGSRKQRDGYLFAPRMQGPFGLKKSGSSFVYWHPNYDTPAVMEYRGSEIIQGVITYRYEAHLVADQTSILTNLPGVGSTRGVVLDVDMTTWIEPTTGYLVKYADKAEAFYYSLATGERLSPWNRFRNVYNEESIRRHVALARQMRSDAIFSGVILPFAIFGAALIALAACFIRRYTIHLQHKYTTLGVFAVRRHGRILIAAVTFSTLAIVAISGWIFIRNIITSHIEEEFIDEAGHVSTMIRQRLSLYENVLYGSRGLFAASDQVTAREWHSFVAHQRILDRYPGIQGLGYAALIEPEDLASHVAARRDQGAPSYAVYPQGNRSIYSAITYLEPLDDRNRAALGFDMLTETVRRSAMSFARDTDQIGLSGKVTLMQEIDGDVQPGILMYLPLYKKGQSHDTVRERRANIIGYVYSPFRMRNFMEAVLGDYRGELSLALYDGQISELRPENVLFDNTGKTVADAAGSLKLSEQIDFGGKNWTVEYYADSGYGRGITQRMIPILVLAGGLLVAILIAIASYLTVSGRDTAAQAARHAIAALTAEKIRLETVLRDVAEGLVITDTEGKISIVNASLTRLVGFSEESLRGRHINDCFKLFTKEKTPLLEGEYLFERALKLPHKSGSVVNESVYLKSQSGSLIECTVEATPMYAAGELVGVVEVFKKR